MQIGFVKKLVKKIVYLKYITFIVYTYIHNKKNQLIALILSIGWVTPFLYSFQKLSTLFLVHQHKSQITSLIHLLSEVKHFAKHSIVLW